MIKMEDDFDSEVIRLKKLLEEGIVQVEKENMAILQSSSKNQKNLSHSVKKSINSCPHIKASPIVKQNELDVSSRDIHSQIHFLKDLESSLLATRNKRKIFVNDCRNRYIPCAIPLSPPVRLKKDVSDENLHSTSNIQNHIPVDPLLKNACNQPLSKHTCNKPLPIHTCNKAPKKDFAVIEKNFPSTSGFDKKESFFAASETQEITQVKEASKNTSFISEDKASPSFRSSRTTFLPSKKVAISSPGEQVPKSKPVESFSEGNGEKYGLNLQITLDSCSTKDIINEVLCKIPELVHKFEASCNKINTSSFASTEQKEQQQHSQIFTSESCKIPELHRALKKPKQTMSSCTQTTTVNFINPEFIKIPEKQNQIVASSAQTDQNKEELPISRHELNHLVKEIVLETLQNTPVYEDISFNAKIPSTCQKVDSGIQSEIECDIPDVDKLLKIEVPRNNSLLFDPRNTLDRVTTRDNSSLSKGVQVNFISIQNIQEKDVLDKSCNTENPDYSFELHEKNSLYSSRESNTSDSLPDRNASPDQESNNKIEAMLEKIYEHVCQDKEVSKEFNDIPLNKSILTRDVAVQFNPLHTCTKSTLTSEIKRVDSSSQYEIDFKIDCMQKSFADASIQAVSVIESDLHYLQVNTYTQCEQKSFIDSVVQTELLLNSEHSATNTSVSSTPVSDSMFMDDLLSDGEITLPWNLRLLSLSGGNLNMNNADSSDTSIKEKDYSLSEGEIPPNVIRYLNMCHCSHSEENDLQHDIYPTKLVTDAKINDSSSNDIGKPGQSSASGKNLRLHISSSSLSDGECNSNASLSLGEVSPGFRVSFSDSPGKTENHPSIRSSYSGDKFHCDQISESGCMQMSDISGSSFNSSFPEYEQHQDNKNEQTDMQNTSRTVLQTVDEEVHSIFD